MKKIILILFATLAIASCDLLYNQDSDSFAPVNDISISAIETTPFVKQGEIVTVGIIVTNSGTNTVDEEFEILLNNQSEGITIGNKSLTSSLAPKDSIKVNYSWDTGNIATGAHILVAKHTFEDDNAANDSLKSTVTVSEPDIPDIAISEVRLPDTILEGDLIDVEVDVKNIGSQDVNETFTISLNDVTDGKTIGSQEIDGGFATGDSTTVTYSWDTKGYSIGEHELSASHDFEDGNTANDSSKASVTINDMPVSDIAIASIDVPADATQGTEVEVSVTVENVGSKDTAEDVIVTLSDQTDGKQIASKSISGLEAENTAVLTFVWDTDEAGIGEHTLLVSHNFEDENTANDTRTASVTINDDTPVTDIAISEVRLPDTILEGDVIDVEVDVKNIGNQDVNETITIALSDLTDGTTIGTLEIDGGFATGDSTTVTYSWDTKGYSIGEHELSASHDFEDGNTTNDSHTAHVTINDTSVTDIAIASIEAPSEATQGTDVEVSVTVENVGNKDTAEDVIVTLSDQTDGKQIASKSISGLEAENTAVLTFVWDTDEASIEEHSLEASHDFNDENTANDTRTASVTINDDTAVSDIAIASIEAPSEATQGTDVELKVEIKNQGNQDVDNMVTIALVDQNDGATIDSKSISGGIDSEATKTVTFNWDTDGTSPGEYTLAASHNLDDDNSDNDSRSTEIRISEAPVTDIAVTAIEAPSEATQGDNVELKVEIKNQGNQDVDNMVTIALVDQNDGTTIDSKSISGGIDAEATKSVTFNWDTDGTSPGEHTLAASHNHDDDNSDNDSKSIEIEITEAVFLDVAITTINAPDDVEQDDKVTIEVMLENLGNRDFNEDIMVTLVDQTENKTIGLEKLTEGLKIGSSKTLNFKWNAKKTREGEHTLKASHNFTDDNLTNNARTFDIEVEEDDDDDDDDDD